MVIAILVRGTTVKFLAKNKVASKFLQICARTKSTSESTNPKSDFTYVVVARHIELDVILTTGHRNELDVTAEIKSDFGFVLSEVDLVRAQICRNFEATSFGSGNPDGFTQNCPKRIKMHVF